MLCSQPVSVSVCVFDKSQNTPSADFGGSHITHNPIQPFQKNLLHIGCPKPKSMTDSTMMLMRPM